MELFSGRNFFRFFSMLGRFWEVLGGQNGGQNRFLGSFFAMLFSSAFRHRFRVGFGRLRTLKIYMAPQREHDFRKIDVFDKCLKKARFWLHFRRIFCDFSMYFWYVFFASVLLRFRIDFGIILGACFVDFSYMFRTLRKMLHPTKTL